MDAQAIKDAAELLDSTVNLLHTFTGLVIMIFIFILLLGIPAYSYKTSFIKYKDDMSRNGILASNTLIHLKSAVITIITMVFSTIIIEFIFKGMLEFSEPMSEIMKKILKIG